MPGNSGHLQFEFTHGAASARPIDPESPLRILVIGDFGARWHRVVHEPFIDRQAFQVAADNIEAVLGSFGANLTIPLSGEENGNARISARSIDDFHPDILLKKVPSLAELLALRKALETSTPHAAADKLQALLLLPKSPPPETPDTQTTANPSDAQNESTDETLTRLLGEKPAAAQQPGSSNAPLSPDNIIQKILGTPSKSTPPPAGLAGLIDAAEMELSTRLRSLLHDTDLQAVEATWRCLDFLARRCPDEERVEYYVLDASLEEIASDLKGLHKLVCDESLGAIIGLFTFGETAADLETLGGLGALARSIGAVFLAGAHPQLVGCDSFEKHPDPDDWNAPMPDDIAEAWKQLRKSDAAEHIGLALPRFLLRQPYGKAGDAIERFAFEEITDSSSHEDFLWGNSAILCAQLIAEGFAAGERVTAGNLADLQPGHYLAHGGTALVPNAEAWLVDRAAQAIAAKGLIAVQSFKGRDAAMINGIHAICHPEKRSVAFG